MLAYAIPHVTMYKAMYGTFAIMFDSMSALSSFGELDRLRTHFQQNVSMLPSEGFQWDALNKFPGLIFPGALPKKLPLCGILPSYCAFARRGSVELGVRRDFVLFIFSFCYAGYSSLCGLVFSRSKRKGRTRTCRPLMSDFCVAKLDTPSRNLLPIN